MNKSWNKKYINFEDKKVLRKMFFQKKEMKDICDQTKLTCRVIYRVVKENKWIRKRERYWLFLIKRAYRNNKSMERICEECGIKSINILRRIKQKNNIKTKRFDIHNKKIDKNIEQKMIKDYNNLISSKKIAEKYEFKTHKTVLDILCKYGVKRREAKKITYYNINYFKKIDSHSKAYIMGLLLTDGYILRNYVGFGIQLREDDGYILENISARLGRSASVIFINCENKRKKARHNGNKNFINVKDMKRLTIYNREIAEDLKKLGVVKNKTFIVRCPKIKRQYLSSFFRGVWDGDGTIGIAKTGNIWCKVASASKLFLKDLKSFNIPFNFVLKEVNSKLYKLRLIGGNSETIRFLKWIYKYKEDLYLKRKYAKVQNQIS